jgi:hypothetical protein
MVKFHQEEHFCTSVHKEVCRGLAIFYSVAYLMQHDLFTTNAPVYLTDRKISVWLHCVMKIDYFYSILLKVILLNVFYILEGELSNL